MADIGYIGENTDLVLGQEFLTWLWFRSETGNVFRMESPEHNGEPFTVAMEQRIVVRGGEGENQETATVVGSFSPLREARLGLLTGKQVVRALVRLEKDGMDWQVTLKAEDFSINSPAHAAHLEGRRFRRPGRRFFWKKCICSIRRWTCWMKCSVISSSCA